MTRHILIIDPIEKLVVKKDSSLMLALTLKQAGHDVYLTTVNHLSFQNTTAPQIEVFTFNGKFADDGCYLNEFSMDSQAQLLPVAANCCFHMRLDPPFDLKYLRTLWLLQALKLYKCQVVNDSEGILLHNEKLYAYTHAKEKFPSYLGQSERQLKSFLLEQKKQGVTDIILKPVDLFQGEGVEKHPLEMDTILQQFQKMKTKYQGAVIVQPYAKSVEQGEIRSIFFDNKELGSIIKIPPQGSHLANIARGAQFSAIELNPTLKQECLRINESLAKNGVRWTAFDILDNKISEVNITCPGLLVEVSFAMKRNLAADIIEML
ncbi:MAG: hypothetical protein KDD40_10795 [Bdellovibrionales bacterium]|nr:hypothetical protein [Bdellovibrionales bacterium]